MVDGITRANSDSCDMYRCRWPGCDCYSPQGPQSCIRQDAKRTVQIACRERDLDLTPAEFIAFLTNGHQ